MKKIIKFILSLLICYLIIAFIEFDFEWYLGFKAFDETARVIALFFILLFALLFYSLLSLIE